MLKTLTMACVLALAAPVMAVAQTASDAVAQSATNATQATATAADGLKLVYYVHGDLTSDRTPVLILHGAYMSADAMAPLPALFADRPVIAMDLRGHGRTGDHDGPITYEAMADDAAAVLAAAGVSKADVVGYSMGAGTAIQLAIRHPETVNKLVSISGGTSLSAMYPEVIAGISQMTPEIFAGSPMETEYKRLSPTPDAFPVLFAKLKALDAEPFDWPEADIRGIAAQTMIISGDYDVVRPEHSIELFRRRGGGDANAAAAGMLMEAPPARLAILPASSHIGVMAQPELLVALIKPFLDDQAPANPEGFF